MERTFGENLPVCPPLAHSLLFLTHYPIPHLFHGALASLRHIPASGEIASSRFCARGEAVFLSGELCIPSLVLSPLQSPLPFSLFGEPFPQPAIEGRKGWRRGSGSSEQLGPITSHCRSWGDVVDRVMHRACPS